MESLSVAWTSGPDCRSENACNINRMNMVDSLHAEIRNRHWLSVNQCFKHLRILIPLRIDGWMSGTDNVSWMDDCPRKMRKSILPFDGASHLQFFDSILAERIQILFLCIWDNGACAMTPDTSCDKVVLHLTFQCRNQRGHIRFSEADLIHNSIWFQGSNLLWEFRVIPVKVDLLYTVPAAMGDEWLGIATAHIDDLKAILHKHGDKVCPNLTFSSNNNSTLHGHPP